MLKAFQHSQRCSQWGTNSTNTCHRGWQRSLLQPKVDWQSHAGDSAGGKEGWWGMPGTTAVQLPNWSNSTAWESEHEASYKTQHGNRTEYIQGTNTKRERRVLTHQQGNKATVRNNCGTIYGSKFLLGERNLFLPTSVVVSPCMASFFFAFFRGL